MKDLDLSRLEELKLKRKKYWNNWYKKNKKYNLERNNKWRKDNPEKIKISKRKYWDKWYSKKENKEIWKIKVKEWKKVKDIKIILKDI
jgi:hypothetical protein